MEINEILDVTLIEPRLKHPTIFKRFDNLKHGEAFILHNDHDPKPLYYHLLGEKGNVFTWEYLEQGPEWWKIKIIKNVNVNNSLTIGEIVAKDIRKAEVFKKHGIDFCCGGNKLLKDACAESGIMLSQIETELLQVENNKLTAVHDYNYWQIDFLSDYIINTHHRYVKENIDLINELAIKVANVHGDSHKEVIEVAILFSKIVNEFPDHLKIEEDSLFPYIKNLVQMKKNNQDASDLLNMNIENPINVMRKDHDEAGGYFKQIRKITYNFSLPRDACNSYSYLYKKLIEFEDDLHQHVHLENNILFPKAIEMEKELKSKLII